MNNRCRVVRVAHSCVNPPCPCSHDHPVVVWEGTDPAEYKGGLGAFDEGCCHPVRTMEVYVDGVWVDIVVYEAVTAFGDASWGSARYNDQASSLEDVERTRRRLLRLVGNTS